MAVDYSTYILGNPYDSCSFIICLLVGLKDAAGSAATFGPMYMEFNEEEDVTRNDVRKGDHFELTFVKAQKKLHKIPT